jgi:ABC-type oligopeptide transport system substrate-binding subunit
VQRKCRRFIALALALAVAATMGLAGCSPSKPSSGGNTGVTKGGTLSYYIGEPAYIDPYNTQESEGTQVEQAIFDSLTAIDPLDPTKVVPAAADRGALARAARQRRRRPGRSTRRVRDVSSSA